MANTISYDDFMAETEPVKERKNVPYNDFMGEGRKYETTLSSDEEIKFGEWKAKYAPNDSGQDYDLRGAFKSGLTPNTETGHWPDTYKKPNHPTFSNESIYSTYRPDLAGNWNGNIFVPPAQNKGKLSAIDNLPNIELVTGELGDERELSPVEQRMLKGDHSFHWSELNAQGKMTIKTAIFAPMVLLDAINGIASRREPNTSLMQTFLNSAAAGMLEPELNQPLGGSAQQAYPNLPWQVTGAMGAAGEIGVLMPRFVIDATKNLIKSLPAFEKVFGREITSGEVSTLYQKAATGQEFSAEERKIWDFIISQGKGSLKLAQQEGVIMGRKGFEDVVRNRLNLPQLPSPYIKMYSGLPLDDIIKQYELNPEQVAQLKQGVTEGLPAGAIKAVEALALKQPQIKAETPISGTITPQATAPKEGGGIYYHATNQESANVIKQKGFEARVGDRSLASTKGKGVWLYENSEYAKEFGKNFKNPVTIETKVEGKIFDATNNDKGIRELAGDTKLIRKLKSEGYIGITGDEMGVNATFIFEPSKLSLTGEGKVAVPKIPEGKIPTGKVKGIIRANTGQIKVGDVIRESDALKRLIRREGQLAREYDKEKEAALSEQNKIRKFEDAIHKEVESLIRNIRNAGERGTAVEYQDAIDKLRDKFDLRKRTEKTIAKRESMKAFVERMKAEGREIDIPEKKLSTLDKISLNDMTLEQLRELEAEIKNLERLGRTKLTARKAAYEAEKEKAKQVLLKEATPINSAKLAKIPIGDRPGVWAKECIALQNYAQKTGVGLTPIDGLADVTGMKKMKVVLDKDFSSFLVYNDKNIGAWYQLTRNFTEKEFERIGAVAASRQEGGLDRLLNSGITEEEVNAIILTPEEEQALKFVVDSFDKEFPAVKQYMKEVYNADVGQVENYVSFFSDYELMSDLEIYERFGQTPEQIANRKTKTTEKGFTEQRANISNIKLEINIDKIFRRHLDDVAYMLNTGKDIKMYFEIVNSPEMKEKLGDVGTLAWLQWLDLMARKGGVDGAKRIAALDVIRKNIGAGVLAFRLSSALVQFSSFADTIATIGPEWATRGATGISTSREWRDFIMDNFPEIKKAVGDDVAFREFGEGFMGTFQRKGMKPLTILDGLMRSTAACGSYQKLAQAKGVGIDLKNPDADLILEATRLMRNSQGSSFFKDQPLAITAGYGLSDNRSLNKAILTFQSFMLGRWDNINRQVWRLGIKEKNYGKAIASAFWLMVFAGAVETGIRATSRKLTGTARKDENFLSNTALNVVQSVPLLGQLVSAITYSSNPVPIINAFEDAIGGMGSVIGGKETDTKIRGVVKFAGAAGSMLGIPGSSQASQIIRGRIQPKKKSSWGL